MVDINPWGGNYTNTVVQNNTIVGAFATEKDTDGDHRGDNNETAIMKYVSCLVPPSVYCVITDTFLVRIGIAIGPRTWFGGTYLNNISFGGTVLNNRLSGGVSTCLPGCTRTSRLFSSPLVRLRDGHQLCG